MGYLRLMNEIAMASRSSSSVADRFESIMAGVDAWADENAGWDCRSEAEDEVRFMLEDSEYADWSDERIVEAGIAAWRMAE